MLWGACAQRHCKRWQTQKLRIPPPGCGLGESVIFCTIAVGLHRELGGAAGYFHHIESALRHGHFGGGAAVDAHSGGAEHLHLCALSTLHANHAIQGAGQLFATASHRLDVAANI